MTSEQLAARERIRRRTSVFVGALSLIASGLAALSVAGTSDAQVSGPHYRSISVRDFIVDGPTLAAKGARVQLSGAYTHQGNGAVLYADWRSLMMVKYGPPDLPSPPSVPLLTDNASHEFREALYSCDSAATYGTPGCLIVVRGRATTCVLTNGFGAQSDSPCVAVEDGGTPPPAKAVGNPPPPTARAPTAHRTTAPAPPDTRTLEQKVRDCIHSPEMAEVGDVYRKCLARVQGRHYQ